jgi:hypothetical protein
MDPISNVDQIILVLRQRLQQRSKTAALKGGGGVSRTQGRIAPAKLASVKSLASLDGVDDRLLRRTLIQNILSDQFGPDLVNDARFQQVVDQVTETLEEDEQGSRLLAGLLAELRATSN